MHDHKDGLIEGLIEKNERGVWVMSVKVRDESRVIDVQVDYCPFCGKKLS